MSDKRQPPPTWKQRKATIKHKWIAPFQRIEWACEWLSYRLSQWAFIEVLEYGGKLAVVVTALVYIFSWNERKEAAENAKRTADEAKKASHYVAWQTLNSAVGKQGNMGRLDALQDLNEDGISLQSIDLSDAVFNEPLRLTNASMPLANFHKATLMNSSFSDANLHLANFSSAIASNCDFRGADLSGASFTNAYFVRCDFSSKLADNRHGRTLLNGSAFEFTGYRDSLDHRTGFNGCSFVGASFAVSDWRRIQFYDCNFAYANLYPLNMWGKQFQLDGCNFYGVTNASIEFLELAAQRGAVFVDITKHDEWLAWLRTNRSRAATSANTAPR